MSRMRSAHAAFKFAALVLATLTGLSECAALARARTKACCREWLTAASARLPHGPTR